MSTQAPTQGCQGPGYYTDPRTGDVTWHGPASLEVAYWKARALAAESQLAPFYEWQRMREANSQRRFWHTPEKGKP